MLLVLITYLFFKCNDLTLFNYKITYTHNVGFSGKVCDGENLTKKKTGAKAV